MLAEKIQLEEDEVVLALVRKHWFVIGLELMGILILALIPTLIPLALTILPPELEIVLKIPVPYLFFFGATWFLIMWMALFNAWTNYYLDVWTITNKRLISVDQQGLFRRKTGSFRLERLQDINVSISGIIATFLNFGTLEAETASGDKDFVARGIPKPQELKALILKAADQTTFHKKPLGPENAGL